MSTSSQSQIFECCKKGKTQQLLDVLNSLDDIDIFDERGNSMVCIALKNGQWNTARTLFEKGLISNPVNPFVISACQYRKDDTQGLLLLLKEGTDIHAINSCNRTALMTSCLLGHIKKTQILLKKQAQIDWQDNDGNTALIEAIQSRNKPLVDLLIKQKPNINLTNKQSESALIVAVKQKTPIENVIKLLLNAGADPELVDNEQKSAWLIAKQKHNKIAKLIEKHLNNINQIELPFFSTSKEDKISTDSQIKEQAVINAEKKSFKEELIENTQNQDVKMDKEIIQKPMVINKNKAIKSNLQEWFHAAKSGNLGGLNRMIIDGIDINCVDNKGCSALIRACGHSRRAVVSFLLKQNADIELRSDNGSTALSSSIIGNCRRVAGLLLEKKANPNGLGPADYSYTTLAAAQWNEGMLSILYRSGGDIFITNQENQNLYHIIALAAQYYNNINGAKSSVQFLNDHGVDINHQDINGNSLIMVLCGAHKKKYKVDDRNIASLVYHAIKLGATPALTNNEKKSALDFTRHHQLQQTKGVIMNALSWNDS